MRTIPLPANFLPEHPFDNGELTVRDEQLEKWPRTPDAIRRHLHEYYACITSIDGHIGRLLQTLQDVGRVRERTIIIFSSDNGLAIGSHGLMGKQNLYEDGMKVPLICSADPASLPVVPTRWSTCWTSFPRCANSSVPTCRRSSMARAWCR